ncbi:hypothetical protein R50072_22830 [Simiduia litorea]
MFEVQLTDMGGATVIKSFQCICLCVFSLSFCVLTSAQEPASDYLISPDNSGEDNLTPIQRANPAQKSSARNYLNAIEDIESDYGAYDLQLSQHLFSLGEEYQNLGEHEEAIEVFTRAMHVQRINLGLYDMGQVPILENLIESQIALGEWESANERYQYLYWLHRRNYGSDDPRLLPIINKLSNWHLNAYALNISGGLFYHLINAHNLYQIAADIVSNTYGKNDLRMIDPLKGLTASNYFLATYQIENQNKLSVANGSMPAKEDERARLQQYIMNSYNSGRSAINRMVTVYSNNPDAPPASELQAQVALGDWYLLFGKWHSAVEIYQNTYRKLAANDEHKPLLDTLFHQPVPLPDLPLIDMGKKSTINTEHFVLAKFDVSAYGRATHIDIIDAFPEDNSRMQSRVRKALKQAKFRPRFNNGEAVDTEDITHRYLFSDEKP